MNTSLQQAYDVRVFPCLLRGGGLRLRLRPFLGTLNSFLKNSNKGARLLGGEMRASSMVGQAMPPREEA